MIRSHLTALVISKIENTVVPKYFSREKVGEGYGSCFASIFQYKPHRPSFNRLLLENPLFGISSIVVNAYGVPAKE
jgi:hypothetical protein